MIQESLLRDYHNAHLKPLKHSLSLRLLCLRAQGVSTDEKISLIESAQPQDVDTFLDSFLGKVHSPLLSPIFPLFSFCISKLSTKLYMISATLPPKKVFVESLAHGNLAEEEAKDLGSFSENVFSGSGTDGTNGTGPGAAERPREKAVQLPAGKNLVVAAKAKMEDEKNSVVEVSSTFQLTAGRVELTC